MKNRSPMRIVELCVYVLIIIAAVIWLLTGGRLYDPAPMLTPSPPPVTETESPETAQPPPIVVPRRDVFTGQ